MVSVRRVLAGAAHDAPGRHPFAASAHGWPRDAARLLPRRPTQAAGAGVVDGSTRSRNCTLTPGRVLVFWRQHDLTWTDRTLCPGSRRRLASEHLEGLTRCASYERPPAWSSRGNALPRGHCLHQGPFAPQGSQGDRGREAQVPRVPETLLGLARSSARAILRALSGHEPRPTSGGRETPKGS